MIEELNLFGVYAPAALVWAVLAAVLAYLLRNLLLRSRLAGLLLQPALLELGAGMVLAGKLGARSREHFGGSFLWNHHQSIDITEHNVSAAHTHAGAFDWNIALHHAAAAPRVERTDPAVEHQESQCADLPHVPHQSICYAPQCTSHLRCSG